VRDMPEHEIEPPRVEGGRTADSLAADGGVEDECDAYGSGELRQTGGDPNVTTVAVGLLPVRWCLARRLITTARTEHIALKASTSLCTLTLTTHCTKKT
jgi:hypothetical protein